MDVNFGVTSQRLSFNKPIAYYTVKLAYKNTNYFRHVHDTCEISLCAWHMKKCFCCRFCTSEGYSTKFLAIYTLIQIVNLQLHNILSVTHVSIALATTVLSVVHHYICGATVMWLWQNLSITKWRYNFVIFLFTDVNFIHYSSSITYEIDVIK